MRHFVFFLAFLIFSLSVGCDKFTGDFRFTPDADGLQYSKSTVDFDNTYNNIVSTLENNPNIGIVAQVDHTANAASVDFDLRKTRLVLFGNPNLGTPLMQANQLAGIDLPQKMMVFEKHGKTFITYNSVTYLSNRHSLGGVATLDRIAMALNNIASNASGAPVEENASEVQSGEGIVTIESANDFQTTYDKLRSSIEKNENLRLVIELDHQANAARVGLELRPTRLLVFGNPNLGTPLMQESETMAIDLPQKMLVWENAESQVFVTYNDPEYVAERHGITNQNDILTTIAGALNNLATNAASSE
ncbi:DUF302 domain-containing protein [Allomuricauda sp. d1]|uniref:DUF302 domain-containing protein n=1 Tax=Allomuricauda sp. d1 TaxID=3136725 RepID=UPI0031E0F765